MSASHHDPVLIKLQLIEKFRLILVKSKQNEGEATKEAIQFLQELQKNQPLSSADQFEILMSLAKSTAKKGSDKGGVFIFLAPFSTPFPILQK